MNKWITGTILILLLMIGGLAAVQGEEMNRFRKPEGRMKPPPEAIEDCIGRSEGTWVQFTRRAGIRLKAFADSLKVSLRQYRSKERHHREANSL